MDRGLLEKKETKKFDLRGFSLAIIFHAVLIAIALFGFNSVPLNFTEKPNSPINATLYVPVIQKETNVETTLSPQNESEIALPTKRPVQSTSQNKRESIQIPVTSSENTKNVSSALLSQPKIEMDVRNGPEHAQFDSLNSESGHQFRFEIDKSRLSNDQETRDDIFATKAIRDLDAFNQKLFETLMQQDIQVMQKLRISPDLDIPVRTHLNDDKERMEDLAIAVDCDSISGGTLILVSRLLNGTLGTNRNSQTASAHNSATSFDRIKCPKTDIDQFIQRRLNNAQD
ncbi:hypothetical protein [Alteromonas sp. A079]|uniref:hypothetical protein n=1 Tax=Alteromonas sp. A079 TaxID=3410268 RepID=UPI003BA31FE8